MPRVIDKRLKAVARGYEGFVQGLPEPLSMLAERLPKSLAPEAKNLVEYYGAPEAYPLLRFPLWLEEKYITDGLITGAEGYGYSSAYASLMGYLYIRIQDNVLDEPEQFDSAFMLLGNEFVREFFGTLNRLFGHSSPFWDHFRNYWLATTNNTLWERMACGGNVSEFKNTDLAKIGGKLDGAKIPVAAICILAGREEDIARYGAVYDDLNIASQLHNDAVSFVKDLRHDYFTCLIASTLGNGESAPGRDILCEASIKALTGSHLEDWLEVAVEYNEKALELLEPGELPGLDEYVRGKNEHLTGLKKDILEIKRELLSI